MLEPALLAQVSSAPSLPANVNSLASGRDGSRVIPPMPDDASGRFQAGKTVIAQPSR